MESQELEASEVSAIKLVPKKRFAFGPHDLETEAKHIFRHHVFVADGVEFKELLSTDAWTHIANRLRPMSRISVTSESSRFIGELVVMSCGSNWAKVEEIFYKEFNAIEAIDVNGEYEIKWVSNRYKFGIRRLSDGEWMQKDIPDQAAANIALATYSHDVKKAV